MKKKKPDMLTILLYAIIIFAVLYVSAGLGAAMDLSVDDDGVLDFNVLMTQFETVLTSTDTVGAHFTDFSSYSFKITLMVGFALGIYALMKYTSRKRLHRKGVEHGSARWANEKEEKFLADRMSARSKPKRGKDAAQQSLRTATKPEKKKGKNSPKSPFETDNNILLTQEVRMSLNTRQHRENLNVLVIGGSGSGKSRFYVKPNIMQLNTSYVVTDPKGELLRSCGRLLKKAGYEIRVFNLIDMSHSNNYNPFNYIYDKDGNINKTYVMKMVNCLMKNTKQEGASGGDQFWDDSTKALTLAIAFYLLEKKTDENGNSLDRNFSTVMKMMRLGTPATRAAIIEKILADGYAERKNKVISATEMGIKMINFVPSEVKSVEMTAAMELQLATIENGTASADEVISSITEKIKAIIEAEKHRAHTPVAEPRTVQRIPVGKCPKCGGNVYKFVRDNTGIFYCEKAPKDCIFRVYEDDYFFTSKGKKLTEPMMKNLLSHGEVKVSGFKSEKTGNTYNAVVSFADRTDKNGNAKIGFTMRFEDKTKR